MPYNLILDSWYRKFKIFCFNMKLFMCKNITFSIETLKANFKKGWDKSQNCRNGLAYIQV